jgi:hypothetical protein
MPANAILPMPRTVPAPRPPDRLWGIWAVDERRPDGYWWNHTNGRNNAADAPMTFLSRADALAMAEHDQDEEGDTVTLAVALIGVAPPTFCSPR